MSLPIRKFGDPVLKAQAAPVTEIDGKVARLIDDMFDALYDDSGLALAAPQVGVQKQVVVWDLGDEQPQAIINPQVVESGGEWLYEEGCLSIPGLYVEMLRPKLVLVRGVTVDGNEIEFEADELAGRMFQHEIDHLNGVLMFDRMEPEQRKAALAEYRRITEQASAPAARRRLRLK